jgi:bifunctional UDP-N-acetylglucosamine pyrophosphorylase/glucosamine-1-phosphate N-acetyltransferase
MIPTSLAVIVLAAGKGTRMRSDLPKVLHPIAGKPMLRHALAAVEALDPNRVVVVVGPDMAAVEKAASPHATAIQREQLGTAHAVAAAQAELAAENFETILIVYGDTPLITPKTLRMLIDARKSVNAAVAVLGMRPTEPGAYGRLILDERGQLSEIVEAGDATSEQLKIDFCNSGVIAADGGIFWRLLREIGNANAKGEYYLTDIIAAARERGLAMRAVEAGAEELAGVNSRLELAAAEAALQRRLRESAMLGGATLTDPASVFFAADTKLGRDVVIGPQVFFGPDVTVGDRVQIRSFSHIEGANIGDDAIVGPFARLRPGTDLGAGAHVGNFVEIKSAVLGPGAKANHLSYIGDATVGADSNIGAGTITCNYDGFSKFRTSIGADVFIGTNSSLVAPVTIGDGATTAAGSVITEDVPADALALGRARQVTKLGRAAVFRAQKRAQRAGVK